jgi:hypothetical protein
MVFVRRVACPVRICVVRRHKSDLAARFCYAVKLCDKTHYVRHVLDDVKRDDLVKFIIGKRIRKLAEVVYDVGPGLRIVVKADSAGKFVSAAAYIEDLHVQKRFRLNVLYQCTSVPAIFCEPACTRVELISRKDHFIVANIRFTARCTSVPVYQRI